MFDEAVIVSLDKFASLIEFSKFSFILTVLVRGWNSEQGGDLQFYYHVKTTFIRRIKRIMVEFSERKNLTNISDFQFFIKEHSRVSIYFLAVD
jgi:hypothetical protein